MPRKETSYIYGCMGAMGFTDAEIERVLDKARVFYDQKHDPEWEPTKKQFLFIQDRERLILLEQAEADINSAYLVDKIWDELIGHPEGPGQALKALVSHDNHEKAGGIRSLERNMQGAVGRVTSMMQPVMKKLAPRIGLMLKPHEQRKFIKAIFNDGNVDPEFKAYADAYHEVVDYFANRFQKAERYGLLTDEGTRKPSKVAKFTPSDVPIVHHAGKVSKMGFDAWHKLVKGKLNSTAMGHNASIENLRNFYDNLVTDGMKDRFAETNSFGDVDTLTNRMNRSRYLIFQTADDWLNYNDAVSVHTPYSAMMDHLIMMAHETAQMETLGATPNAMFQKLKAKVENEVTKRKIRASESGELVPVNKIRAQIRAADHSFKYLTGKLSPQVTSIGDTFQTIRNVYTAIRLPAATLSAMPDVVFSGITAQYNGIPAWRVMTRFAKELSSMGDGDEIAAQMMFPLMHAIDSVHGASRYADVAGRDVTARATEATMRLSGLNHWTVAGKRAFYMEFMGALAKPHNKKMMRTFKNYGITPDEAKKILASKKKYDNGMIAIDPQKLDDQLAERIVGMAMAELKYAVPEADATVHGFMTQGSERGTATGEVWRSAFQFKTFSVTVAMKHWSRMWHGNEGNVANKLAYGAKIIVGTTALGALALNLKEIAAGREPIDFEERPDLWVEAMLAGGALSLMGDMVFGEDFGQPGMSGADLLGPGLGDIYKSFAEGVSGTQDVVKGRKEWDEALLKGTTGFVANHFPGKFWYTKAVLEKYVIEELHRLGDPDYDAKKMRRERIRQQKFGNKKMEAFR